MKKSDLMVVKFCPLLESVMRPLYFICYDITVAATPNPLLWITWTVTQKIIRWLQLLFCLLGSFSDQFALEPTFISLHMSLSIPIVSLSVSNCITQISHFLYHLNFMCQKWKPFAQDRCCFPRAHSSTK